MTEATDADTQVRTDTDRPPIKKPADLSKFQLRILAVLAEADDAPKGVTVKRRLQAYYDDEVNHGQLYPNLNELAAASLISKGRKDDRTNAYDITDAGRNALATEVTWLVERTDGELQ